MPAYSAYTESALACCKQCHPLLQLRSAFWLLCPRCAVNRVTKECCLSAAVRAAAKWSERAKRVWPATRRSARHSMHSCDGPRQRHSYHLSGGRVLRDGALLLRACLQACPTQQAGRRTRPHPPSAHAPWTPPNTRQGDCCCQPGALAAGHAGPQLTTSTTMRRDLSGAHFQRL